MGKFQKGNDPRRNTAGRPKGAKGKTPEQIRSMVQAFITDHWDEVETAFLQMDPKDKVNAINNLLKHILPPPVNGDNLTIEQMESIIQYLKSKHNENN